MQSLFIDSINQRLFIHCCFILSAKIVKRKEIIKQSIMKMAKLYVE